MSRFEGGPFGEQFLSGETARNEEAAAAKKTEHDAERKEKEPMRRTFEYRDTEGRLLGSAEIELGSDEVELEFMAFGQKEKGRGRTMKSFVLRGVKDGAPTAVDVMALINPRKVDIVVASGRLDNYGYDPNAYRATVPMPETPFDIGVGMHELGHADQFHEERFEKVTPLSLLGKSADDAARMSLIDVKEALAEVVAAVPEASALIDPDLIRDLDDMEANKRRLLEKKDRLEDRVNALKEKRDVVLHNMVRGAVTAALPEGFAEEVKCTFDALDETWDEKKWNEKTAEYMKVLDAAGFRFAQGGPKKETKNAGAVSLDVSTEPVAEPHLPFAKEDVAGIDDVLSLLKRFDHPISAGTSKISYAKDGHILKAEIPFPAGSFYWNRSLELELPLSEDDHARYAAERAAVEVELNAAYDETTDLYKDILDAGDAYGERIARSNFRDILTLPRRMMERDATRRAYQWMRKIRQDAGIDLFARHVTRRESTAEGKREAREDRAENCESSTQAAFVPGAEQWAATDTRKGLDAFLKTYGAEHPPLKKRGS